jgi:hypothetical protein
MLNQLTIHEIAIRVYDNPGLAITELQAARFIGDMADIYRGRAYATVAEELAQAGHTQQAIKVASEMAESFELSPEKSKAFSRIAAIVQQRRAAQ